MMEVLTEQIVCIVDKKLLTLLPDLQCLYILGAQLIQIPGGNHTHAKNYPNIVMTQLVPLKNITASSRIPSFSELEGLGCIKYFH